MRKLCLSRFRLLALFCCLVAPPFTVSDSLNQDERQHVTTFIVNLAFFFNKECLLCQKRHRGSGRNTLTLMKHAKYLKYIMSNIYRLLDNKDVFLPKQSLKDAMAKNCVSYVQCSMPRPEHLCMSMWIKIRCKTLLIFDSLLAYQLSLSAKVWYFKSLSFTVYLVCNDSYTSIIPQPL